METYTYDQSIKKVNYKNCQLEILKCVQTYQDYSSIIKTPHTVKYQLHQVKAITNFITARKLTYIYEINETVINDFINYSKNTCKNITINKRIAFLKLIYKHFRIDFPYLLELRKLKQDLLSFDIIPEHHLKKLLEYINTFPHENYYLLTWKLVVLLLLDTGVRALELEEIQIKNIDFHTNMIKLDHTKSKKQRYVFFTHLTSSLLQEYISIGPKRIYLLFNFKSFNRFNYRHLEKMCEHFEKKLNITHLHPHMFRHTMATLLVENGCPLDTVQSILGHSNIATTQIYLHMSVKKAKNDFDKYSYVHNTVPC
jgi:integrase